MDLCEPKLQFQLMFLSAETAVSAESDKGLKFQLMNAYAAELDLMLCLLLETFPVPVVSTLAFAFRVIFTSTRTGDYTGVHRQHIIRCHAPDKWRQQRTIIDSVRGIGNR